MLFSVIFLVAVFFPSHIKAKLKYPMLTSVKTWALAHLISNGDLGSILLFGTFLGWAVFARISASAAPTKSCDRASGLDQRHHCRSARRRCLSRARLCLPSDLHRRSGFRQVTRQ